MASMQDDFLDIHANSKIHLHPLCLVGRFFDLAMVSELRAFGGWLGLGLQRLDLRFEFHQRLAALFLDLFLDLGFLRSVLYEFALPCGTLFFGCGISSILAVRFVDGSEDGLQAIVMFLCYGISFVLMTTSALDGDGAKGVEDVGNHVVAIQIASYHAVDLAFRNFGMADVVPRTRSKEPET